jgi:DNA polymerase-3 subunit delta
MLYILHGPDSYSRHEALAALRARLDADGMLATGTTVLDARGLTLHELLMVCDAAPFLSAHRLVHVRGLLAHADGERPSAGPRAARAGRRGGRAADGSDDAAGGWLALADYVERMPASTVLVLEDGEVRPGNRLLAALSPRAEVHPFPRLSERMLQGWIAERARRRGVLFENAALRLLAACAPMDLAEDGQWHTLWWLAGEIEKLSLFAAGERISESDVRRLVPAALESRVYLLADRVMERRGPEALTVLEELLAGGRPPPVLLATLASRVRQLLLIGDLRRAGVARAEIMARVGVRGDWQFDHLREQAERIAPARLEAVHARLLQTDRAIKHGRVDEVTAIELLVAELAGQGA